MQMRLFMDLQRKSTMGDMHQMQEQGQRATQRGMIMNEIQIFCTNKRVRLSRIENHRAKGRKHHSKRSLRNGHQANEKIFPREWGTPQSFLFLSPNQFFARQRTNRKNRKATCFYAESEKPVQSIKVPSRLWRSNRGGIA